MKCKSILNWRFVLSSLMILGLASCGGTDGGKTSGDLDNGLITNIQSAKTYVAEKADTRTDAYSAKKADGSVIGNYKTIASAINAAVDYDCDVFETFDSYVTKIDDDYKLFQNREGYSEGNDDQFWYYENGTSVDAYNCWDSVDSPTMLRNTNYLTSKITYYGQCAYQDWNSYTLLDAYGDVMNDTTYAQYYELSSTMDAAVIAFTARRAGITKLHYEIDLSDVRIAPSYTGCDKTYAFIGFYAWQDYYVIANGIACDTSTGNWYQFIGTSRDNSFSDVTYNIGDCIMTSTYNENGGYFTPDSSKLTLEISTKIEHDDDFDEDYQIDYLSIEADGAGKFEHNISDATVNEYFSTSLGIENSYVFIAGLDIKGEDEEDGTPCKDYFNGSYFTGLKVTNAYAYVPTTEEMDSADYGFAIKNDWRGKEHDILLANLVDTESVMDYTILNTGLCAEYQAINECDVYNFSYTGKTTSSQKLGTNLKYYQDKVDGLSSLTQDDLMADQTLLNEIGIWYEDVTKIPQKYRNLINWEPYLSALERLGNISMSEDAKQILAELKALDVEDYIAFGEIYENDYLALTEDDQTLVKSSLGKADFENKLGLYNFYKDLQGVTNKCSLYNDFVYVTKAGLSTNGVKEWDADDTLDELIDILKLITAGTEWQDINDDPNTSCDPIMNGDHNFWPSLRAITIELFYKENGLTLPSYIETLNAICEADNFITGFYNPIFYTAKLALRIETESLTTLNDLTDDEIAFLNEVWTANYQISELISYQWESEDAGKFETWYSERTKGITVLAGGDATRKTATYFTKVGEFLTGCGYVLKESGWGVTSLSIKK